MNGKTTRIGLYKCYACRQPFNVKVGTIFEKSHVPMRMWLQAFHLMASSKKGISANQLHRTLKLSLKSAWFVGHRIREAMRSGSFAAADGWRLAASSRPTDVHRPRGRQDQGRGYRHKHAVLSLVERGGQVRSVHVPDVKTARWCPSSTPTSPRRRA